MLILLYLLRNYWQQCLWLHLISLYSFFFPGNEQRRVPDCVGSLSYVLGGPRTVIPDTWSLHTGQCLSFSWLHAAIGYLVHSVGIVYYSAHISNLKLSLVSEPPLFLITQTLITLKTPGQLLLYLLWFPNKWNICWPYFKRPILNWILGGMQLHPVSCKWIPCSLSSLHQHSTSFFK